MVGAGVLPPEAWPEGHLVQTPRGTSMTARHRGQHRPGPRGDRGCSSEELNVVWLGPGATGREIKQLEQRARGWVPAEDAGVWG